MQPPDEQAAEPARAGPRRRSPRARLPLRYRPSSGRQAHGCTHAVSLPTNLPQLSVCATITGVLQITASVTFLPLLHDTCTFDLLVYTDTDSAVPVEWCAPWSPALGSMWWECVGMVTHLSCAQLTYSLYSACACSLHTHLTPKRDSRVIMCVWPIVLHLCLCTPGVVLQNRHPCTPCCSPSKAAVLSLLYIPSASKARSAARPRTSLL